MPELMLEEAAERVLHWYGQHGRKFPWRKTQDPYKILISEVLLQKTQAETVEKFYERFLGIYPTFEKLSTSELSEVEDFIKPLGLAYRARRLVAIAKEIQTKYGGAVPNSIEHLLTLHGVGYYMAQAVLCFAFDQPITLVDVNVMRILGRAFGISSETEARRILTSMLPKDRFKDFNWALIDLGAAICTPRNPRHSECPIDYICKKYPIDPKKWRFLRKKRPNVI